jgi:hypothetical protein
MLRVDNGGHMSVFTSRTMRPFHIVIALLTLGCSSTFNTVRLKQTDENQRFTLSTRHYLQTDDDHVAELDKGERQVQFDLVHDVPQQGMPTITLQAHLRLYREDKAPSREATFRADETNLPLSFGEFTFLDTSENVTVLDTGQRGGTNPALASNVQAQTGYITFGKPTAAGAVGRLWRIYTATAKNLSGELRSTASARQMSIKFNVNGRPARALFEPAQIEAWQRLLLKQPDLRG